MEKNGGEKVTGKEKETTAKKMIKTITTTNNRNK